MEINILTIVIAISLGAVMSIVAFILSQRLKKSRYDDANNKALLESYRDSLEKQMYIINERLVMNEERWRDVNHLFLKQHHNDLPIVNSRTVIHNEFLKANGIAENDLIVDSNLIFILTPFNDKYAEDFYVMQDICMGLGFKCNRGDEKKFIGDIFPEMLKLIVKANLIIANINGRNPNVLYELGIAQALDKTVILVSREPEKLPSDIKSKRFLIYSNYTELQSKLREELINILPIS